MRGRTVILITHRLELVRAADEVVVLDGARIAERGSPAEVELTRGAFSTLFATGPRPAETSG
jgi:ABC-type multidrug transport system fused ATPase/permease subunit